MIEGPQSRLLAGGSAQGVPEQRARCARVLGRAEVGKGMPNSDREASAWKRATARWSWAWG